MTGATGDSVVDDDDDVEYASSGDSEYPYGE